MQRRSKLPESCRRLAEVLVAAGVGFSPDGGSIVVVASRNGGEGVTTVSALLAEAFVDATGGPVMLIDAEKGGAGPAVQHQEVPSGQAEAAAVGSAALAPQLAALAPAPGVDLKVLVDDGALAQAVGHGDSRDGLVQALRAAYRVVVVDAGSMRRRVPYLWSRVAHQTLLVVDTQSTTVESLTRLRSEAEAADIRFTGMILNRRSFHVPRMFYSWAR